MSTALATNMVLPEDLLLEARKAAETEGRTVDALVREALESYLQSKRLREVFAYGERQAQKAGIVESDVPQIVEQWRRAQTSVLER